MNMLRRKNPADAAAVATRRSRKPVALLGLLVLSTMLLVAMNRRRS